MKYFNAFLCTVIGFMFTFFAIAAFAEGGLPPAPGTLPAVGDAISAIKVGAIAPIIVAIVQVLRSDTVLGLLNGMNKWWVRLVIVVATVLGNVAYEVAANGKTWLAAAIEGLVMGGGAMAIYDTIKSVKSS